MLPPATERVWNFLKDQRWLAGFVLVGGSALALRISHRLSEDLDLAFPDLKLPRARLDALLKDAAKAGFDFQRNDNEAALNEFLQGGGELHDYQQDFVVDGQVKVSFFAPDAAQTKLLRGEATAAPRIAELVELFKTKALVSAVRSKTRDWIDLYVLMREHGFTLSDYAAAFKEAGVQSQCETGLARLCSGQPQADDEGFDHLLKNPLTVAQMRSYFEVQRDEFEIQAAKSAKERHQA